MAKQTSDVAARGSTRLRCAIYTRKSSEEGLEQDFNSLDAQREACEAFIASQKHEGWSILPEMYDDGGFSGGTIERPARPTVTDGRRPGKNRCGGRLQGRPLDAVAIGLRQDRRDLR